MANEREATFFSYASADKEFVLRVVKDLRDEGCAVWLDQLDIVPGQRWDIAIESALRECQQLVTVLSPSCVSSPNVMDEVSYALEERKRVIPLLYRDCTIPFRLRRLQYIDFRADYSTGLQALLRVLRGEAASNKVNVNKPKEGSRGETEIGALSHQEESSPLASSELRTRQQEARAKKWGSVESRSSSDALLVMKGHSQPHWSVAWSPNGKWLASASADDTAKIWNAETGNPQITLEGHSSSVATVAWSPNGKRLATGSFDKTAQLWNIATGTAILTLEGHTNTVRAVVWSPDGGYLASGGDDATTRIWNTESGSGLHVLKGHGGVFSLTWSPDGKLLATGNGDGSTRVWAHQPNGAFELTKVWTSHASVVTSIAWSPGGRRLATASMDGTAKVWDREAFEEILLIEMKEQVRSVAWSPDGKMLATGGYDKAAKVWHSETGEKLLLLRHRDAIQSVQWSPDGKHLATGDDTGVRVWATVAAG